MARVFLIGFGNPDSSRLADEMDRSSAPHEFADLSNGVPEDFEPDTCVALIWCPRSLDETAQLISETVAKGLPTVALLHDSTLPVVDLGAGHVELVFPPAQCAEALQRIELVLARAHGLADRNLIQHGDLVIDQDRYEVRLSGRKIDLTYKEYELLRYIAARPGRVFSREALLRAVWDYDYFGGTRTVDVHVRRLRSKINDVRYQFIETVWNVGYRFSASQDTGQEQSPD